MTKPGELEKAEQLVARSEKALRMANWRMRTALILFVVNMASIAFQTVMLVRTERNRREAVQTLARAVETYRQAVDVCQHPNAPTKKATYVALKQTEDAR